MEECKTIVEGWHYGIGVKWITVYRGSAKRYRIEKTEKVLARLEKEQANAYGPAKTTVVVNYITRHGQPCFKRREV